MDRPLVRYRVMAWTVGTMLFVLCVVAIPLQYAFGHPLPAEIGFDIHGIVYLVYLVAVADLARKEHFALGRIAAMVASGFVPGLAFVEERRVSAAMALEHA